MRESAIPGGGDLMNRTKWSGYWLVAGLGLGLLAGIGSQAALTQTANQGAGQDIKDAGTNTKGAAKDTGQATAKVYHKSAAGTKKVYRKTAHGTKTAYRKTVNGTKDAVQDTGNGAKKVGDKVAGKPDPQ